MATVVRFQNMEFSGAPREVYVNPALVSCVGTNEHGVTYLTTPDGRVLVRGTPEEALALLGMAVPADTTPIDVPTATLSFDAAGKIDLGHKQITALEMTDLAKKTPYVYEVDYAVDPVAGVVSIVPAMPPPAGTLPAEPKLKPGMSVRVSFSYLKPPPPAIVPKGTLLKPVAKVEDKK